MPLQWRVREQYTDPVISTAAELALAAAAWAVVFKLLGPLTRRVEGLLADRLCRAAGRERIIDVETVYRKKHDGE